MVTKILARYHLPEVPSLAAAGLVPTLCGGAGPCYNVQYPQCCLETGGHCAPAWPVLRKL